MPKRQLNKEKFTYFDIQNYLSIENSKNKNLNILQKV